MNPNAELSFADIWIDEVFSSKSILQVLKKYDKFLEVYNNDPANNSHPLPMKITQNKVVNNQLIRSWAAFKAPPLLLTFVCGRLPPNGDAGVRVREIFRAFVLASAPEYQQKPCGEILNIILRVGGAIKHMAGDKSNCFNYISTYMVDVEVLRDEASTAMSLMEQDKEGIRIDVNTPVLEVVNLNTFLDLNLVVNNTEVPPRGVQLTRSDMWYTANQDYYYRTPGNTSQDGDHSHLLNEEQLQRLCGHMYDFAKQVGYGLRTYNREVTPSSSTDSGAINIHQLAMMLKQMPTSMDHPLGFALNSLQAFAVCLHVIHTYTSWREYGTDVPYYRWTDQIVSGTDINTLEYLEFHMNAVCELYSQNGLQLPNAFRQYAWNQMGVWICCRLRQET